MTQRVVITGMAGLSSIGQNWDSICARLKANQSGIVSMPEWDKYQGLNTRLAGPITDFTVPEHYSRKSVRSMGRIALLATRASELALANAELLHNPVLKTAATGVAYGSSAGSTAAISDFGNMLLNHTTDGINATTYIKMMSHTAAVNIGVFFQAKGRIIPTSSACTSGSQAIGFAYEAIRYGKQQIMIAGGAEELCATEAAVFDTLYATSTKNEAPHTTPRPFDQDRDGLVIGEGAGTLILENLEHAQERGAKIYAEIVGFACNSDGQHITQPQANTMQAVMEEALSDAELSPADIGYISAHGTATEHGDIAESNATHALFAKQTPISSMKSYLGHTLGACGALEAWFTIEMMNSGWFAPTINLDVVDPRCADLDYITGNGRTINTDYCMSNNFAFGGINTSLLFKRWA